MLGCIVTNHLLLAGFALLFFEFLQFLNVLFKDITVLFVELIITHVYDWKSTSETLGLLLFHKFFVKFSWTGNGRFNMAIVLDRLMTLGFGLLFLS